MAVSGFQKLTVAAVVTLCAALILPKMLLRREPTEEQAPGRFPPMMHRHMTPNPGVRGHGDVRGAGSGGVGTGSGGAGTGSPGGKSNLAAQIIPVYGFGILLYILYILFKITSKGGSKPAPSRLQSLRSENNKRKITDFELSQLQERLMETEVVMETLVNSSGLSHDSPCVSLEQEQSLLQQLTAITQVMRSNHLVQDFTPFTPSEEGERDERDLCDNFEPFWSRCDCHCQTHKEQTPHEDWPIRDRLHEPAPPTEERQTHHDNWPIRDQSHEPSPPTENRQTRHKDQPITDNAQQNRPIRPQNPPEQNRPIRDEHQELAPQTADQPDEDRPIRDKNWEINNALASPTEEREMESDRGEEEEREEEKRQETVNRCLEERKNWEGMSQNAQHEKKEIQREGEERAAREEERGWRNFEGEKRDGEREKRREKSLQSREERHLTLERRGEEEKAEQRERVPQTNVRRRNRRRRGRRE